MNSTVQKFVNSTIIINNEDFREDAEKSRALHKKLEDHFGKRWIRKHYFVGMPTMFEAIYILYHKCGKNPVEVGYIDGEAKQLMTTQFFFFKDNIHFGFFLNSVGEIDLLYSEGSRPAKRKKYETKSTKEFLAVCRELRDTFSL